MSGETKEAPMRFAYPLGDAAFEAHCRAISNDECARYRACLDCPAWKSAMFRWPCAKDAGKADLYAALENSLESFTAILSRVGPMTEAGCICEASISGIRAALCRARGVE